MANKRLKKNVHRAMTRRVKGCKKPMLPSVRRAMKKEKEEQKTN
jgi:hypothetical protein